LRKKHAKLKYDPETDTIMMIKRDLADNEELKRVVIDSYTFQEAVNKDVGEKIEKDIDSQIEEDFKSMKSDKCPAKKHMMNLTTVEFNLKESLFINPMTNLALQQKNPLDSFRFQFRHQRKAFSTMRPSTKVTPFSITRP
jgi:hypothetical protein